MPTGTRVMEKIADLARERPVTAIIISVIFLGAFIWGTSYSASFLGQGSKISREIAELKHNDKYLESLIESVDKARIEEHTRLKEDKKLMSEPEIRLIIKEELQKFGDRLVKRLQ